MEERSELAELSMNNVVGESSSPVGLLSSQSLPSPAFSKRKSGEVSVEEKESSVESLREKAPRMTQILGEIPNQESQQSYVSKFERATELIRQKYEGSNKLVVSSRQRKNKILSNVRNVLIQYEEGLLPDFHFSKDRCGVFIALSYHLLYSDYVKNRISSIRKYQQVSL